MRRQPLSSVGVEQSPIVQGYSKDNIKVILKRKTTFFTLIKFAGASHMHLQKLQDYPQGSDPHVTLGRWNILFIPPRL